MASEITAENPIQSVPEAPGKTAETTTATVEVKPIESPPQEEAGSTEKASEQAPVVPTKQPSAAVPEATTLASETTKDAVEEPQKPEAPAQPEYLTKVPGLEKFFEELPSILQKTSHSEMWGVSLKDSKDIPTVNVLIKFLRANEGNVQLAVNQLTKALEWRKEINPIEIVKNAKFSAKKFQGMGYITSYLDPTYGETVFTWNIYGGVKDLHSTFGDLDEFIRWRTALMEKGVQELKLNEATEVIDYNGEDRYQMLQVHDYKGVSFLRLDPVVRAASKKTIEVFSTAYPELLREKFFVNVPTIMGWMFGAMKIFLSKNTIRKFHPISNGANLGREFAFVEDLPKSYGGQGAELKDAGRTVPLVDDIPAGEPAEAATESAKETAAAKADEPSKDTTIQDQAKNESEPATESLPSATPAPQTDAAPATEAEAPKEEPVVTESNHTEPAKPSETEPVAAPAALPTVPEKPAEESK